MIRIPSNQYKDSRRILAIANLIFCEHFIGLSWSTLMSFGKIASLRISRFRVSYAEIGRLMPTIHQVH